MNDQDANLDASFRGKVEKGVLYCHPKGVRPKPKRGPFGPFKVSFGTPKVPNGALGCRTFFRVQVRFGLSFQGFFIRSLYLDVFSSLVYAFYLLDNSSFFRNNYLVDKYPKINLDKVQIIHNFIFIQSSLLFLCMQSYFKH